ncbi:conserved hypothetical protein [Arcobacter nitrofigilis DSM 7299]|uniref:Uncharacterized protein n=1 Tax=Arcobacter nitrofigilis (strain ATCC 33309 / DSM 7299 / CCUG 15893 / LMG 7604 / NCTC 12251 / CI) TaxID=572480 RepID=D5V2D8_ARCNC|nr:hypothetical protein [Arcobacter nitrofigilis]ADG92371.1 conserved hypothetical protein [Arcobacter nitrofigilis DSM 7299]
MGLKKYIAFSLLLIIAVYIFVFSIQTGNFTVSILDYSLALPIAVWVVLPLVILFLVTILHIVFYGFKNYLQASAIKKDEENIIEFFKDLLLGNNSNKKFKQKALKELADILVQMKLSPKVENFESSNSDIKSIVNNMIKINSGEYVSDKSFKFNKNGQVSQKNILNKVNSDLDYAIDVLKKSKDFSDKIVKAAFLNVVENKSMTTIKKLLDGLKLDKEMVLELMKKDSDNSEFALEHDAIIKYTKEVEFDKEDYLTFAKLYKKSVQPDELIKMFETISNDNELAMDAYLVVLFEYEMIDKAREILNGYKKEEYQSFRALLDLKDSGKYYTLENLCYNK